MPQRDAFDLTDLSDLPESICPRGSNHGSSLYEDLLLAAGRPVDAAQVRIAMYRLKNKVVSRQTVTVCLGRLVRRGIAVRPGRGLYVHRKYLPAGVSNIRPKKRAA